ncbi:MAG: TonB-dependent receptor, partial [Leptospiraceae bacterium]|nr:TonB-dependent receptor [Leptospiraceae bacterium]
YNGQPLRSQGWARDKDYEGSTASFDLFRGLNEEIDRADSPGDNQLHLLNTPDNMQLVNTQNVATGGSRLKKTDNLLALGVIHYQQFEFTGLYTDQQRDNYNFYRDRNEIQNTLRSAGMGYTYALGDQAAIRARGDYAMDDTILHSHTGLIMGGTREIRYGGSLLFTLEKFPDDNRLAVGAEYRRYDVGLPDRNGNNFIVNNVSEDLVGDVNSENRYVFSDSIIVSGFFLEDVYHLTHSVDLFGGLRYDRHSFWGYHLSPRFGVLWSPLDDLRLRSSYQRGFRGAPGVAFAGGFQKDGLLRTENYDRVASAQIPTTDDYGNAAFYQNVPEARPETIDTYELAVGYDFTDHLSLNTVLFYNIVKNIVDVGVIFTDPDEYALPEIGTDEPGDWSGYFFFRNLPGIIRNAGGEITLTYRRDFLSIALSHAHVSVVSASDELFTEFNGGMYLSDNQKHPHHRAYPEDVSRLNLSWHISKHWRLLYNHLYYYYWYSPFGERVVGQHVAHTGVGYTPLQNLDVTLEVKNVFDSEKLWPMNSNAGGPDISNGTPALEGRSFWMTVTYRY